MIQNDKLPQRYAEGIIHPRVTQPLGLFFDRPRPLGYLSTKHNISSAQMFGLVGGRNPSKAI